MRAALLLFLLGCAGQVPHQVERGIAYDVRDCEYLRQRSNPFWYARCTEDGNRACAAAGLGAACWREYDLEVEWPDGDSHWLGW